MRTVCITGVGVALAGAESAEDLWRQLSGGVSQLSRENIGGQERSVGRVRIGDDPPGDLPARFWGRYSREIQIYLASLEGARAHAGIELDREPLDRIGLFDGVSRPASAWWVERPEDREDVAAQLLCGLPGLGVGIAASLWGIRGPTYTYNTTCVSGAVAIGQAVLNVASGQVDVAFAGGHEASLTPTLFETYDRAGLLSDIEDPTRAVAPWGECRANVFGEGSVVLVLESLEHATARGAKILARVRAVATGNAGGHPLQVDPSGERSASLMEEVLARGGVRPEEVGFVVGHGNAVRTSDESEENYMRRVFGRRSGDVPLVSVKPVYGHTLGASSALNVAAAALMVQRDFVVPTLNAQERFADVNHQAGGGAQRVCDHGLAVAYGMGGQNAVVLISKEAA